MDNQSAKSNIQVLYANKYFTLYINKFTKGYFNKGLKFYNMKPYSFNATLSVGTKMYGFTFKYGVIFNKDQR